MKPYLTIFHLVLSELKFNKKKTLFNLVNVILCVSIVLTSLVMLYHVRTLATKEYLGESKVHYAFSYDLLNELPPRYFGMVTGCVDEGSDVRSFNGEIDYAPFKLIKGELPSNDKEVIADITYSIGDVVAVDDCEYIVVGLFSLLDDFIGLESTSFYTSSSIKTDCVYYINDKMAYSKESYDNLNYFFKDINDVWINEEMVQVDTIHKYLSDANLILFVLFFIIILSAILIYISIKNIFVVDENSKKRQFGLLKSIGCGPKYVRYYVNCELFFLGVIGSILGSVLGELISYTILKNVYEGLRLSRQINHNDLLEFMIIGFIIGVFLMAYSGNGVYKQFYGTSAVQDLSEYSEHIEDVKEIKLSEKKSFSWNMFLIFNRRFKKQTDSLLHSFAITLIILMLFSTVFVVIVVYGSQYGQMEEDIKITNNGYTNEQVINELSDYYENYEIEKINIRQFNKADIHTYSSYYSPVILNDFAGEYSYDVILDTMPYKLIHIDSMTVFLTEKTRKLLDPYVIEGDLNCMEKNDVALIVSQDDKYGADLCSRFKIGDTVTMYFNDSPINAELLDAIHNYYNFDDEAESYAEQEHRKRLHQYTVKAIVHFPEEVFDEGIFTLNETPRYWGVNIEIAQQKPIYIFEEIIIHLNDPSSALMTQNKLDYLFAKTASTDIYSVTNYTLTKQENQEIMFFLQMILYPLFFQLAIIGYINIYFVAMGNMRMKSDSIKIFRLVGAKTKQIKKIFYFEYLESYFNASFLSVGVLVFFMVILKIFNIYEQVAFLDNMLGCLIFTIMFAGPVFLIPILCYSMLNLKKYY